MPSIRKNKIHCQNYRSEIEVAIELVSGKWVVLLLVHLGEEKVVRFNAFRKAFPDITQKMLSQQLKKLEENRIITKKVFNQTPPKVEYRLTDFGNRLIPILDDLQQWGKHYITDYNADEEASEAAP